MFSRWPEAACSSLILGTEVNNVPLTVNGPLECSELGDGLSEGCIWVPGPMQVMEYYRGQPCSSGAQQPVLSIAISP